MKPSAAWTMSATNVREEYRWPGLAGDAFIVERCCRVALQERTGVRCGRAAQQDAGPLSLLDT